jgi:hypothetical protein
VRKINTVLIDCVGASKLVLAGEIAEKHSVLDATGESICYIDLGSPDEILIDLVAANIITKEDMHELINSTTVQLILVA